MADNILDQLKAFQEAQEAARKTTKEIQDQRDLLRQVSRLAADMSVSFNEHTENIGKSAQQLKIGEELESKISNSIRDRNSFEKGLITALKQQSVLEKDLIDLQRIKNLDKAQNNLEYTSHLNDIDQELRLGQITSEEAKKAKDNLKDRYRNTQQLINQQEYSLTKTKDNVKFTNNILNSENKKLDVLKRNNGFMQLGKKLLGDMGPLGEKIINFRSITAWSVFTDILEKGYENFKAFDKASVDVRKNLGALPGQASVLENRLKSVTVDMMHLGATFDDVAKSMNEITNEFTALVAQDEDLLKTTTALAKQFGIAEGTSVKFLKTSGGISGNSASSQKSMIGFAQKMAQASGVPLGKIMEDVANASDDVRVYVGSSAVSMIKAATAARMMGIDLNKAASSAEKLLQFESSIASELKASALLGQNVNFNYARQLAFNKDIIGANKEILKITKQVNFNQLNPIQQKAFADAAGKSVSELQDMLTQEKNIQLVRNGTNEKAKKALVDYERMMQLKDEEAKNEGKVAEQQILQRANQERLNQLQNQFNKLISELAQPVMDIVEPLLDLSILILPALVKGISVIGGLYFIAALPTILSYIRSIGPAFMAGLRSAGGFIQGGKNVLMLFRGLSGTLGAFLRLFGTKIPIIGWIISGFLFIRNLIRDVKRMFEEGGSWGSMIVKGLLLIPKAIIEAFLPFDIVKKTLDEWFFGKSPSKAGKLITKGFSSIGPELQDSLTSPINESYKDIKNMEPPEVSVDSKNTNKLNGTIDNTLMQTIQSGNQQLIAKIDQLITMMANGGIAVNIDGQLVNRAISTSTLKSGGFGQSTTRA